MRISFLDRRDEPSGLRLARMRRHREAEIVGRFHRPDLKQRWSIGGVGGKCRRGELAPGGAIVIRAMQLGAEMTVLEGGVNHAIRRQCIGHRDAVEANESRDPARAFAFEREQSFARRYQQMVAHHSPARFEA
jgi:hypothetical protein